jgi:Bacterial Ig-like domain (group 3)
MHTWAQTESAPSSARQRRHDRAPVASKGALVFALLLVSALACRAAGAHTYIWPDCDTTHPCVVHHIDTVGDGTASGETLQDFKFPMEPSSPGNLLVFTVMHVSSKTIAVTDNKNGAWQTAVTTANAADGEESELLYICGATAGTSLITIHLSQPAVHDEPLHFTYDEVSGIAPTACLDGTAAANGLQGTIQPGPVTTTADGDLIFNYGEETYQYPEYDAPIGGVTPDSNAALLMENIVDKYASEVSLQATHGAYTPALSINTDPTPRNWNSVAAAFKASPGAGTQPAGIHITRILHFVGVLVNPVTVPFPSSGNAIVISTSNPSVGWDMANLTDNEGHTYTRTPFSNDALDPQIFSTCLGSGTGGQNLVISWTPSTINNHVLFYDIAGAATTGGSTGCVGATVNTILGFQPPTLDAPMTGDPVITPTTPGSVIVATSYVGTGPPSASLTPGVVFNSIWATGMIDSSSWDTGDPYAYAYTTSTSPISFNWQMANSTGLANGGTNFDGAAIEILPGSTVATTPSSTTLTASATQITSGAPVTLTATVASTSAGAAAPTGSVNFYNGATLLGTAPLTSSVAALTTSALPAGTDSVSATYTGSSIFAPSTSSSIAITVTGTSTPVPVITAMSPLIELAGNAAFTLTITGSGFTSASTIMWGTSVLATQFVSASQLTTQVSAADVGSADITSVTVRTPAPGGGTSNAFQFEVDSASSSVTPPSFNPSAAAVAAGSTATYSVTLPTSATNVSASCLNLPPGASCSYSATAGTLTMPTASTTPAGTWRVTVVFTETLPVSSSAFALLPIFLLPLCRIGRGRSPRAPWLTPCLALVLCGCAVFATGCGGGNASPSTITPPQTHQLTSSAVVILTVH